MVEKAVMSPMWCSLVGDLTDSYSNQNKEHTKKNTKKCPFKDVIN